MVQMVESVRITNKDILPEELAGYTNLGKTERGKVAGEDDEGKRREVGESAASLLLKVLVKVGAAEEELPPLSLETALILRRLEDMSERLAKLEAAAKNENGDDKNNGDKNNDKGKITPEMQAEINRLVDERTQNLTERVTKLENDNKELKSENEGLKAENERLKKELADAKDENQDEIAGFKVGDDAALAQPDGKYKTGYEVVSLDKENNKIEIKNKANGVTEKFDPDRLKKPADVLAADLLPADGPPPPMPPALKTGQKVDVPDTWSARFRRKFLNGSPPRQYQRDEIGYFYIKDGEPYYVPDWVVEQRDSRGGLLALGAVTLAAIGLSIAALVEAKDAENKHHSDVTKIEQISNNNTSLQRQINRAKSTNARQTNDIAGLRSRLGQDEKTIGVLQTKLGNFSVKLDNLEQEEKNEQSAGTTGAGSSSSGATGSGSFEGSFAGSHTDFYNRQDPTHRLTGVELSKELHLRGKPGAEQLVDDSGKVIVKKVMWDERGLFAKDIRTFLRSRKYTVDQGKLGARYKSIVRVNKT